MTAGVGLATRDGGSASGTLTVAGLPSGAVVERAFLYWAILAGEDATVTFAGQNVTGPRIGASDDPCWFDFASAEKTSVHRADVTHLVTGAGSYAITGVGHGSGQTKGDGHGASLIVVFRVPGANASKTIIINDGALTGGTLGPNRTTISHTFSNINVEDVQSVRLHVGLADAQEAFDDGGMAFSGTPVTPPNFFIGRSGSHWDAATLDVSPSLLPSQGSVTNTVYVGDDCMVWAYAALEIETPPPAARVTQPASGSVTASDEVTIAGTASEHASDVRLTENGETLAFVPVVDGTWSASLRFTEGIHTVSAAGVRSTGSEITPADSVTFRVDTTAPEVAVASPRPAGAGLSTVLLRAEAADGHAVSSARFTYSKTGPNGVETGTLDAACTGCGTASAVFTASLSAGRGTYVVTATATDVAGNTGRSLPVVVVLAT